MKPLNERISEYEPTAMERRFAGTIEPFQTLMFLGFVIGLFAAVPFVWAAGIVQVEARGLYRRWRRDNH